MPEYKQIGVACILMFNDTIDEILMFASESEAAERLDERRMVHFRLQSVMNPSMTLDDYDALYVWHIDYAPVREEIASKSDEG
jgi:hypothetical protein